MQLGFGLRLGGSQLPGIDPLDVRSVPIVAYYEVTPSTSTASVTDLGANGYHLTQATASKRPVLSTSDPIFNGQPSLTGDGVDDEIVAATMPLPAPGTTPRWYWFVFAQIAWGVGCIFGGGGGNQHIVFGSGSAPNLVAFNRVLSAANSGAPMGVAKRGILKLGNTAADYFRLGSVQETGLLGNATGTGFALFSGNGGFFNRCAFNRMLITAGEPSQAERDALDLQASARFGPGILT